jgi:(p)ppGpp synthase/HD superfamily hydrolase
LTLRSLCGMPAIVFHAVHFAAEKHNFQRRKNTTADPYINHCIDAMHILSQAGIEDPNILAAAVLHDTLEDTKTTFEELIHEFGEEITLLVQECTDDKSLAKIERKRVQIEHSKHIQIGSKLVKLADKISNCKGLLHDPPASWSPEIVKGYFQWSFLVCENLFGHNSILDQQMKEIFANAGVNSVSEEEINYYYSLIEEK